ncbi:MAG: 2-amino-5-formylamino-6-ribosylaminopyrimidin- 4(3H)-one 5'-monophosphate deformylase [Candidatus Bathyarchaeota archaeon BA1]|nr:MAG: 2-amino-5-formylamino-6-ribosylaminopyrimidin- 4(3H)-one 5'-monophosphate deformylase [Candidatus Bathyarchaeota archaeon BA1]
MRKYLIEEMTPEEMAEALRVVDTVLVPLGTIEQHGPHLPVGTDVFIPIEVAKRVAEKSHVLVAPPIYYGNSMSMQEMKGVITITPETLAAMLLDLCRSLAKQGFKKIVFINGHGGNVQVLNFIGQRSRLETGAKIIRVDWWVIASEEISKICEREVVHADEGETSMALACRPKLVNMEKAVRDEMADELTQRLTRGKPKNMPQVYLPFQVWTKTGLIGDAVKATAEKGEKILEAVVSNIIDFLEQVDRLL